MDEDDNDIYPFIKEIKEAIENEPQEKSKRLQRTKISIKNFNWGYKKI